MQNRTDRIDIFDFMGIEGIVNEIDFQLGYCKQEYLLDEEVLNWAAEMLAKSHRGTISIQRLYQL